MGGDELVNIGIPRSELDLRLLVIIYVRNTKSSERYVIIPSAVVSFAIIHVVIYDMQR